MYNITFFDSNIDSRLKSTLTTPMSAYKGDSSNYQTMFERVDMNPDPILGSALGDNGALFYHVEASCTGMHCPP